MMRLNTRTEAAFGIVWLGHDTVLSESIVRLLTRKSTDSGLSEVLGMSSV